MLPSAVLVLASLAYFIWVKVGFPKCLHFLPDPVRFPKMNENASFLHGRCDEDVYRKMVLGIGTARVFLQSAIMLAAALSMHDAHLTGNYWQSIAVAALVLVPMPFEAIALKVCGCCQSRSQVESKKNQRLLVVVTMGATVSIIMGMLPRSGEEGQLLTQLKTFAELVGLMIVLAIGAPFNDSRLNQLRDAEQSMVWLEWMKGEPHLTQLLPPSQPVCQLRQVWPVGRFLAPKKALAKRASSLARASRDDWSQVLP